jgi:hypothetical protein
MSFKYICVFYIFFKKHRKNKTKIWIFKGHLVVFYKRHINKYKNKMAENIVFLKKYLTLFQKKCNI